MVDDRKSIARPVPYVAYWCRSLAGRCLVSGWRCAVRHVNRRGPGPVAEAGRGGAPLATWVAAACGRALGGPLPLARAHTLTRTDTRPPRK
ncbi:unnamed protein product, partial [Iphiclides podalirius]